MSLSHGLSWTISLVKVIGACNKKRSLAKNNDYNLRAFHD